MSSPPVGPTDTEDELSDHSNQTLRYREDFHSATDARAPSDTMNDNAGSESRTFGTAIQKFSKDLIKSLGNFKFLDELTNDNYIS